MTWNNSAYRRLRALKCGRLVTASGAPIVELCVFSAGSTGDPRADLDVAAVLGLAFSLDLAIEVGG